MGSRRFAGPRRPLQYEPALQWQKLDVPAGADVAPDAGWREHDDEHGDGAHDQPVPGPVVGKQPAEGKEDRRADNRPLDGAYASDHDDEGRGDDPVEIEGCKGGNAENAGVI